MSKECVVITGTVSNGNSFRKQIFTDFFINMSRYTVYFTYLKASSKQIVNEIVFSSNISLLFILSLEWKRYTSQPAGHGRSLLHHVHENYAHGRCLLSYIIIKQVFITILFINYTIIYKTVKKHNNRTISTYLLFVLNVYFEHSQNGASYYGLVQLSGGIQSLLKNLPMILLSRCILYTAGICSWMDGLPAISFVEFLPLSTGLGLDSLQ